jgi:hypothetical protein
LAREVFDPIVEQIKKIIIGQIRSSRKIARSEYEKSLEYKKSSAKDKGEYKPLKIKVSIPHYFETKHFG